MNTEPRSAPRLVASAAAIYAIAGGVVTLAGWIVEIPRLTAWKGDGISMFPNSAICAIAAGLSLLVAGRHDRAWRGAAQFLSLVAVLLGGLSLVEHLSGINLGIDTFLIDRPWGQAAAASPMRMGPPGSASFMLLGSALFLLHRSSRARGTSVGLAMTAIAISMLSLTGHLYGAAPMFTLPRLTGIAMQTASMIFALGIGIVARVPEREPMRVMLEPTAAGMLARRAFPVVILLSLTLGWLRVELQKGGLVDTAFGTALRTLVEMLLLSGLLWRAVRMIRSHELALHQSQAEVRRQAVQLSTFFETAAISLHRVSAEGTILWANDAELGLLGYSRDEFIGHDITEFLVDTEAAQKNLQRLRSGENALEYRAKMRCKDGTIKTVLIDSTALWDDGKFVHSQDFVRDITERIRSEEIQLLLSAIVRASDDAIISKSLDGIITSWNPSAERIFGYAAHEAIGKSIDIIIPEDRRGEERELLSRLRRGMGVEHYETVRRTRTGRLIDISLTVSPMRDATGTIVGASKIGRDITDRKRAETEREEANRRKDEFIAILAHELRNPLAPVRNAAFYLKSLTYPDVQRSVEIIERQVAQMSRLIDDLLDVSRISRGVLELRRERVVGADVVEAAVDACRSDMQAKGHTLRVHLPDTPIEIHADRERLVQVLCNLLGNASKYTPAGGHIDLDLRRNDGTLEMVVRDDGVGIAPGKLDDIFELFARVDQSLERQGGLGIGLTLARQIVELHGGTVEAHSDGLGHGSQFVVRLPVLPAPRAAAPVEVEPNGKHVVPRRVLIADDNHDAAESLALLLTYEGHEVHTAFDGEAAILSAEAFLPDVALIDIGMPKANGYQVAQRIREERWGDPIYLVALTGWGQDADKKRARDAGFDMHLLKPVSPEVIEQLLSQLPE